MPGRATSRWVGGHWTHVTTWHVKTCHADSILPRILSVSRAAVGIARAVLFSFCRLCGASCLFALGQGEDKRGLALRTNVCIYICTTARSVSEVPGPSCGRWPIRFDFLGGAGFGSLEEALRGQAIVYAHARCCFRRTEPVKSPP